MQRHNILLAHDGPDLLQDLQSSVREDDAIGIVHAAGSADTCIEMVQGSTYSVILLDLALGLSGVDLTELAIHILQLNEDAKIVLLYSKENQSRCPVLVRAGVSGCVSKANFREEIAFALKAVIAGQQYLTSDATNSNESDKVNNPLHNNPLDALSRRELQVALLLMKGHKSCTVGDLLRLSSKTVSTYKKRAFKKLKVDSLVELVVLGHHNGLLQV